MTNELEELSPLALPANRKPARKKAEPMTQTGTMNVASQLDGQEIARQAIEQALDKQNAEITDALALAPEAPPTLFRRRTQDEMLRALRMLASGNARPRDDDSPQVLEDAVYEVASLRQIVADLMQGATSMYQAGLVSIRKMTDR
jgi:hypothetical protein